MKLINNTRRPLILTNGTILASAGFGGSSKEVEALSEVDRRRYVDTGMIAIAETTGDGGPETGKNIVEEAPVKMVATRKDAKKTGDGGPETGKTAAEPVSLLRSPVVPEKGDK